ncbi:hypothetical protein Salat_2092400 [Sesamum alatum]|uniref:DUF4283 domain-containing protein n=1 Tax=Sesamum alatum TaxID=300844 RepID=A0AAE1Y0J6_9LAMI|nr:hypothetical protein Salat_2092400 [Sesamum alatum]
MDEEIARMNRALSFTVEEEQGLVIRRDLWLGGSNDPSLILVGRILTHRGINFAALCSTFLCAANPRNGLEFTRISTDCFLLHFRHHVDQRRILDSGPWNFDNHLILLGEFGQGDDPLTMDLHYYDFTVRIQGISGSQLNPTLGRLIGSKLGTVKQVVVGDKVPSSLGLMKVHVSLDVRRPLLGHTKIRTANGNETVVTFSYEHLGNFCYLCWMIGHVDSICDHRYSDDFIDPGLTLPYGPWLRASARGRSFAPNPVRILVAPGSSDFNSPRTRGTPSENPHPLPKMVQPLTRENNSPPLVGLVNIPLEFSAQSSPVSSPISSGLRYRGGHCGRPLSSVHGCRGRK